MLAPLESLSRGAGSPSYIRQNLVLPVALSHHAKHPGSEWAAKCRVTIRSRLIRPLPASVYSAATAWRLSFSGKRKQAQGSVVMALQNPSDVSVNLICGGGFSKIEPPERSTVLAGICPLKELSLTVRTISRPRSLHHQNRRRGSQIAHSTLLHVLLDTMRSHTDSTCTLCSPVIIARDIPANIYPHILSPLLST